MPVPVLRHYSDFQDAAVNTRKTVVPAIPAGRALVISKITVTAVFGSASVTIQVGPNVGFSSQFIVHRLPLAPGEVYTETGIVMVAGDLMTWESTVQNILAIGVFGQEVDNV